MLHNGVIQQVTHWSSRTGCQRSGWQLRREGHIRGTQRLVPHPRLGPPHRRPPAHKLSQRCGARSSELLDRVPSTCGQLFKRGSWAHMLQRTVTCPLKEKSVGNRTVLRASFQSQHNCRAMPATKFQTTPPARGRLPWVPPAIGPLSSPKIDSVTRLDGASDRRLATASQFSTANGPRVVKANHADASALSKGHPLL